MKDLVLLLQQEYWIFCATLLFLGACFGSFLNLVALRLPPLLFHSWRTQCEQLLDSIDGSSCDNNSDDASDPPDGPPDGIVRPASRCPLCSTPIRFYHNIPILGYLMVRGRCAACHERISIRYFLVELFTALITLQLGIDIGLSLELLFALVFVYTLITLSLIDFDHHILPDDLVIPLLWLGLIANVMGLFTNLQSAVVGAIIGYMVLWTIYQIHHRLTGKEGMGYGDFKLLAAIGAWLGWQMLPVVILIASVSGTIIALGLMVFKQHGGDKPIPFGPYLGLAAWIAMVWGDSIVSNYLHIFKL